MMYHLVRVGVNIGFFSGAVNELSYKQSEVPGLVKTRTKHCKGQIKMLILFTFQEDGGKVLGKSISTSHNTGYRFENVTLFHPDK